MITFFVTLNWNTTELLKEMVASVELTTSEPHRWIIVDNGSDEANLSALCDWVNDSDLFADGVAVVGAKHEMPGADLVPAALTIIRSNENLGCILAHNLAFDAAWAMSEGRPHEIVMVDTDVTIHEAGWLFRVREWAARHSQAGIVGLEHSQGEICAPAVFLDPSGNWYIHRAQTGQAEPVEGESVGLGLALIRWPVLQAGLRFDTGFEMYYKQDDDFCFQIRAGLGLEVWAFPIGCVHWGSGSLKANEYQVGNAQGWNEFDQVKQANQRYFAGKWRRALRARRGSMTDEARHLAEMKEKMRSRE